MEHKNMNSIIFLRNCKYTSIYYDDMKFYENNKYIKIESIEFEFDFYNLDRLSIHYFCKKSKQSAYIHFNIEQIFHQEKIEWDIIKSIYNCPMSIKKFLEKNNDSIINLISTVKKEFKPYSQLYYGY